MSDEGHEQQSGADEVCATKTAMPGALMFRRSDVLSRIHKSIKKAKYARNLAASEKRWADYEVQAARVRAVTYLLTDLTIKEPVFVNASPLEAIVQIGEDGW